MIIKDLIQKIGRLYPHTFLEQDILDFINEVNDIIFSEVIENLNKVTLDLVEDKTDYEIPEGISPELVKLVKINDTKYIKTSITSRESLGFSLIGNTLSLNTKPSMSKLNGLELIYRAIPEHHLAENKDEDEILIPIQYSTLYEYYSYFKLSILNDEFGKANNYTILFNELLEDLRFYIMQHNSTNDSKEEIESRW